jgi:hypothetical protein
MLDRIAMRRLGWEPARCNVCPIAAGHNLVSTASVPSDNIGRALKVAIGRTRHSAYAVRLIEHREKH